VLSILNSELNKGMADDSLQMESFVATEEEARLARRRLRDRQQKAKKRAIERIEKDIENDSHGKDFVTKDVTDKWEELSVDIYNKLGYVFIRNMVGPEDCEHVITCIEYEHLCNKPNVIMGDIKVVEKHIDKCLSSTQRLLNLLRTEVVDMISRIHPEELIQGVHDIPTVRDSIIVKDSFVFMKKLPKSKDIQLVHTDGLGDDLRALFFPR
jgi:hypothetical protein